MSIAILVILIMQIAIPALLLFWFWHGRGYDRLEMIINALFINNLVYFFFHAGRWDYCGYYLRYQLFVLMGICLIRNGLIFRRLKWWRGKGFYRSVLLAMKIFVACLFGLIDYLMQQGLNQPLITAEVSFPLHNGWYYTAQGGDFPLVNFHNTNPAQRYAIDLVKLNKMGFRASGLRPSKLTKYEIFKDTVFSPCQGRVMLVENSLKNIRVDSLDEDHPSGNNVVIRFKRGYLMLAHLDSGSVIVKVGDSLITGQRIALVGNSGSSSEPHLKVFAVQGNSPEAILHGEGLALTFKGLFPGRNQTIKN